MYVNSSEAIVTKSSISVAIGNGALQNAIREMRRQESNPTKNREDYIDLARISYAWVRPNEGPGNPHCRVVEGKPKP